MTVRVVDLYGADPDEVSIEVRVAGTFDPDGMPTGDAGPGGDMGVDPTGSDMGGPGPGQADGSGVDSGGAPGSTRGDNSGCCRTSSARLSESRLGWLLVLALLIVRRRVRR